MRISSLSLLASLLLVPAALAGCGDPEADELGVGAQCADGDDCLLEGQVCLTQFSGGYCGIADCASDADCPDASACVTHDDGRNYCFRLCVDKPECNANRDEAVEANCSGSITFVDPSREGKACEPPSSGS